MDTGKHFFTTLEALRGIAAIMVMFLHTGGTLGPTPVNISYLAVDLFFLLSGVVLANSYERQLATGQISPAGFLLQRIIRLYPVYLLSLPVGLVSYAIQFGFDYLTLAGLLLRAVLFIPNAGTGGAFPLNGPSWSLFFELWAGVLFSVLLVRLSSRILLAVALGTAAITLYGALGGNFDIGHQAGYFGFGFSRILFSFSLGICLRRLYELQRPNAVNRGNTIGIFLCACLIVITNIPASTFYGFPYFDLFICSVIFPAIVWVAMRTRQTGLLGLAFRWLGIISYPIYILHAPIFELLHLLRQKGFDLPASPAAGMVVVIAIIIMAGIVAVHFDEPVRKKLKTMTAPRPASELPAGAS
ncbi:acyltransferase family protein [Rhizobium binae]|uniref:Peptidoglycan/LPS O-acetylase OafA/YrhL n=1 Tax=Rhizobium binae TaxID=1138190 RepID=A0ABV2MDL5_9HYPH|nr:acyltransferase [Rhizobium binae]NKL49305.1 acyltransferase family protein [Rhizobium leguminosarum bv. viciae]MBX4941302.1 acyltransferase [Rhizobium binae]MBX4943601.1 acyltransferase [Rhizobium binae]MBX4961240.1 acyltransferase [Rhizobium binae]MBX4982342.1 acyltransferase [Rhizobium binae]